MRLLSAALLLCVAGTSFAHVPQESDSLLVALGHTMVGPHHLPMALLIVAVAAIVTKWRLAGIDRAGATHD